MAGRIVDAKRSSVGGSVVEKPEVREIWRERRGDRMRKEEILVGEGRWQRERECVCDHMLARSTPKMIEQRDAV